MNRRTWMVALLASLLPALGASPARAQGATGFPALDSPAAAAAPGVPAPPAAPAPTVLKRGFFTVSGGYQPTANAFTKTFTWNVYAETATATVTYPVKAGFLFDIGGGVRFWRDLAVGAAFSYYTRNDAGPATVSMPSPFDFGLMRTADATSADLTRTEAVLHVQLSWFAALSPRLQLAVSGGPSLFRVVQPFVSRVNLDEVYPYDTLTVNSFVTVSQSASKTGFNAGADLTWMLTRQVGVGGMVRFSRALLSFETPDKTLARVEAGGLQVGVGVRARF